MSDLWKEFKKFAMRGNVIDLAVGVVIGGAFGKIISSLVEHILTPAMSPLLGSVNFSQLYINLSPQEYENLAEAIRAGAPVIRYGEFLNNILNFLIIAFCIFVVVRQLNKLRPKPDPTAAVTPSTKECPFCISTIPLKATRCPQCTSPIDSPPAQK